MCILSCCLPLSSSSYLAQATCTRGDLAHGHKTKAQRTTEHKNQRGSANLTDWTLREVSVDTHLVPKVHACIIQSERHRTEAVLVRARGVEVFAWFIFMCQDLPCGSAAFCSTPPMDRLSGSYLPPPAKTPPLVPCLSDKKTIWSFTYPDPPPTAKPRIGEQTAIISVASAALPRGRERVRQ